VTLINEFPAQPTQQVMEADSFIGSTTTPKLPSSVKYHMAQLKQPKQKNFASRFRQRIRK